MSNKPTRYLLDYGNNNLKHIMKFHLGHPMFIEYVLQNTIAQTIMVFSFLPKNVHFILKKCVFYLKKCAFYLKNVHFI